RQIAETNSQLAQASEARVRQTSYSTEMLFAADEIEGENRGHAMELLNISRPQPGREDLRSWEWRFLWAQCQSAELFTVGTHSQEIYRVAFLPDGRLACGDFGQSVKIWDPKTRKTLASEKVGPISDLEVSPDGTIGLWELATRRKLGSYGKDSMGNESVSFSRDGKRLAAFSRAAQQVKLWDIASGREVARFKYSDQVFTVRFAADDRTLVIPTARQRSLTRAPMCAEIDAAEAEALKRQPLSAR